jgi:hypothetical protein
MDFDQDEDLQRYRRDMVRVLAAAQIAAGGNPDRAIFWFMNEPLAEFGYQTPDQLVAQDKAQIVIDYIESIARGANG